MQKPSIKKRIKNAVQIRRSFALVWKASRKWTLISSILTCIQGVIPLFALYLIKLIVDLVTATVQSGDIAANKQQIIFLVIAAGLIAVIQAAVRLAATYTAEVQAAVVTDYVSTALHKKSIDLDLAYYENPQYYDTLHRAQQEGPYRPTRIVNGLVRLLQSGVSLIAMVGLLLTLHWGIGLLMVLSTVPGVIIQIVFAQKKYRWQKKRTQQERQAAYFSNVLTFNIFAKEVRLFDLGGFFSEAFDSLKCMLRREKLELSRKRTFGDLFAQIFAALILLSCLLFITFRAVNGLITIGGMVMYYQAFQRGITHLKDFLTSVAGLYEDNMFVSYFFEFLDIKNRIIDPESPVPVPALAQKGVSFENVFFQYPGEREPVLKGLSLEIGAGEVVALVGANGAGKSTIVKLLCRLYDPQKGKIKFEGNALDTYPVKDLRQKISVIFQDFSKYFMTVSDNIRFGDINVGRDSEELGQAAQKANADEFIRSLPRGYDTVLGRWFSDGEELSLGEWQKISLARAFLRRSPLIILDEPTSSLDTLTEYHLFTKFKELIAGNSALLISHRFSTVSMADRIYVLDDGQVAEDGTHDELMLLDSIYADMYRKQAAWLKDEK
jgi:ATP-binding cassette subfamily B protein